MLSLLCRVPLVLTPLSMGNWGSEGFQCSPSTLVEHISPIPRQSHVGNLLFLLTGLTWLRCLLLLGLAGSEFYLFLIYIFLITIVFNISNWGSAGLISPSCCWKLSWLVGGWEHCWWVQTRHIPGCPVCRGGNGSHHRCNGRAEISLGREGENPPLGIEM